MDATQKWFDMHASHDDEDDELVPTHIATLDEFLGGGFHKGVIAQIYGQAGTAKTQLAMVFLLGAAASNKRSMYISTEKILHPQRMAQIKNSFQMRLGREIPELYTIRHCYQEAQGYEVLFSRFIQEIITSKDINPSIKPYQLLIVDNISRVILDRAQLDNKQSSKTDVYLKARIQTGFVNNLRMHAKKLGFAVVLVGNVTAQMSNQSAGEVQNFRKSNKEVLPSLGPSWESEMDQSILVSKSGGRRKLVMKNSPKAPRGQLGFQIVENGQITFN